MRILVTGGFGYLGGHLVNRLLKQGNRVRILDSMFNSKPWEFPSSRTSMYRATVINEDAIFRSMNGIDAIYHLADRSDWRDETRQPARLVRTNVLGTSLVLLAARGCGVDNVVMGSTTHVYGNVVGAVEDAFPIPTTYYAATKLASDQLALAHRDLGMNIKILRISNIWGGRFDNSVLKTFIESPDSPVYGDGLQTRDFIYIKDVIDALLKSLLWDDGVYNISTNEETSIANLYGLLAQRTPKLVESLQRSREIFRNSCTTMQHTNWQPKTILSKLARNQIIERCV